MSEDSKYIDHQSEELKTFLMEDKLNHLLETKSIEILMEPIDLNQDLSIVL